MAKRTTSSEETKGRETRTSDDAILKMTKEITVKFIEVGRITPSTFDQAFKDIHRTIEETVHSEG